MITVPVGSLIGSFPAEIMDFQVGELTGSRHKQVRSLSEWSIIMSRGKSVRPVMAVEDFDLDPRRYHSRDKQLLAPVLMIGAIEYASDCNHFGNTSITLQNRALAKTTATDDRLRSWGLYTSGSDHARDATRQAITAIRRLKTSAAFRREVWGGEYRRAALPGPPGKGKGRGA